MHRPHVTALCTAAILALSTAGCASSEPSDSVRAESTPPTSSSTSFSASGAESAQPSDLTPREQMETRAKELIAADPTLADLVMAWESATGLTCHPYEVNLGHQNAAVACNETNALATFDKDDNASQNKFEESFANISRDQTFPDTVITGPNWSAFVDKENVDAFQQAMESSGPGNFSFSYPVGSPPRATPTTSSDRGAKSSSGATSSHNAASSRCPSSQKADSTVMLWNDALSSRGTQKSETLMAAVRAGVERQSKLDKVSRGNDCPNQERLTFTHYVGSLDTAELTSGEISDHDLVLIANAGNDWLDSIGRSDLKFDNP